MKRRNFALIALIIIALSVILYVFKKRACIDIFPGRHLLIFKEAQ